MNPPPSAQADANERAEHRQRRRDRIRTVISFVALVLLVVLVLLVQEIARGRDRAVENSGSLSEQVLRECAAGGPVARQLEASGICPQARAINDNPASAAPPQPEPVFPEDQVRRVVADYLEANPPAAGPAGRAPTAAEIDAAVTRVCASIDCRGQPGAQGGEGPRGQDGDAVTGPPPSDEQVAAAVASYCDANNGCRPTDAEVAAAVEAYCAEAERCRGLPGQPAPLPEAYTRVETTSGLGGLKETTVFRCARTSAPDDFTPEYDCQEEVP